MTEERVVELCLLEATTPGRAGIVLARSGDDVAIADLPDGPDLEDLRKFKAVIEGTLVNERERPSRTDLMEFGRSLFRYVMRDGVADIFRAAQAGGNGAAEPRVRIHLLTRGAALQSLPWEYLQDPKAPAGPGLNVVRVLAGVRLAPPAQLRLSKLVEDGRKVRILFVYADPQDQAPVPWPELRARIEKQFTLNVGGSFELKVIEGTAKELVTAVENGEKYDIFHFAGHGEAGAKGGQGHILLADEKDPARSRPFGASKLAGVLRALGVRMVALSACETSAGVSGDDFNVVAEALLAGGIPVVVANHLKVPAESVSDFVGPMYSHLLKSGDIDLAVGVGRLTLDALSDEATAAIEWGIPTLYRKVNAAQVFGP